jgi:hypothetical protein
MSLASIVGSHPEGVVKTPFNDQGLVQLSRLHAKFWGKSMKDEEEEWRKAQPLFSEAGDEPRGQDQNWDESMDVDGDTNDDIMSGCYALNVDVKAIVYPSIWIRADYKRIYDAVEQHYNTYVNLPWTPRAKRVLCAREGQRKGSRLVHPARRYSIHPSIHHRIKTRHQRGTSQTRPGSRYPANGLLALCVHHPASPDIDNPAAARSIAEALPLFSSV